MIINYCTKLPYYSNRLLSGGICAIILLHINIKPSLASFSLMSVALCSYLNIYGGVIWIFHSSIRRCECKVCLYHRHAVLCLKQSHSVLLPNWLELIETRLWSSFLLLEDYFYQKVIYYGAPLIIRDLPSNTHLTSLFIFVLMSTILPCLKWSFIPPLPSNDSHDLCYQAWFC